MKALIRILRIKLGDLKSQYSHYKFCRAYVTTCHSQNTYIRNGKETSFEAQRTVTNQTASNPREEKQTT